MGCWRGTGRRHRSREKREVNRRARGDGIIRRDFLAAMAALVQAPQDPIGRKGLVFLAVSLRLARLEFKIWRVAAPTRRHSACPPRRAVGHRRACASWSRCSPRALRFGIRIPDTRGTIRTPKAENRHPQKHLARSGSKEASCSRRRSRSG